ncbi:MAG TPA: hypothetical protein VNH18_37125, partial [Bryobacteraceae bacterium]|nr:hypothetical protein [Bryobacteraceae bacterium]
FANEHAWCATSFAKQPDGVTRAASFYIPAVTKGALPALPAQPGAALTGSCRLGGIWYEVQGRNGVPEIVPALTAAWGASVPGTRHQVTRTLFIRGSGLWKDVFMWRRGDVSIWVAWTDWDKGDGVGIRTVVWMQHDRPPLPQRFTGGSDTSAPIRMAGLSPEISASVRLPANCRDLGAGVALQRLSQWLDVAGHLPPLRRAAALLVADAYVSCVEISGGSQAALTALGAKYEPGCPQDGPVYAHNFRDEAEALDPGGPAGAAAGLARLAAQCSLKGTGPWPDRVIAEGAKILRQFEAGPWSPWMRLAVAWAHDVKLLYSMPPGEADIETVHPLRAAQTRQERSAAVAGFARFIREQPDSADAVPAWQEAWRLMAELPPSPIHFGCGCE